MKEPGIFAISFLAGILNEVRIFGAVLPETILKPAAFIKDLAQTIARLTGFAGTFAWDVSKPNGQLRRKLDTTRASALFGFEAHTSLEAGLRRTIDEYRKSEP